MERVLKLWEERLTSIASIILASVLSIVMVYFLYDKVYVDGTTEKQYIFLLYYIVICIGCCVEVVISHLWKVRLRNDLFNEVYVDSIAFTIFKIIGFILAHVLFWWLYFNYTSAVVGVDYSMAYILLVVFAPRCRKIVVGKDFFAYKGKKYVYSKLNHYKLEFGLRIEMTSHENIVNTIKCRTQNRCSFIQKLLEDNDIEKVVAIE